MSELAQGFSDGHSIYGSQETSCIERKGFFMFLSCSQIEVQEFKGFKRFKRFKSVLFVYSVVEKRLPEDRGSIAPLRLRGGR